MSNSNLLEKVENVVNPASNETVSKYENLLFILSFIYLEYIK